MQNQRQFNINEIIGQIAVTKDNLEKAQISLSIARDVIVSLWQEKDKLEKELEKLKTKQEKKKKK